MESLPQIVERNFDTGARKVIKKKDAADEEDTVEKQVAGLADMIIADDEVKRQEELVRTCYFASFARFNSLELISIRT